MAEEAAADEHQDGPDDRIEEVEHPDCGDRNHEEKRAFDAHVGEGLMQTLEDSVAALLSYFRHKPLTVEHRWR
jgi:hypothetical protein